MYNKKPSVHEANRLELLVDYLDISDALITASSELSALHAAKLVKLNRHSDNASAWNAATDDSAPWIQFDMEQEVTVWGVVVEPTLRATANASAGQGVTLLSVAKSDDGVKWSDISGVLNTDYSVNHTSTSWFEEAVTARYWRIQLLAWETEPSLRADLIGQPRGNNSWLCYN